MRGSHSQLIVTTTEDEATGQERPLFAFPVQVCKAVESVEVRFDRADPDGFEVERVWRRKGDTRIFEEKELIRGVRTGDSFATISDADIEAIDQIVSIEGMRVERSLPLDEVPFDRISGSYFLQSPPKGGSHKAYELLRQALAEQPPKGKAKKVRPAMALQVKFTSRSRQKLGVIYADVDRRCLAMVVLTFAEQVRQPDEAILAPAEYAEVDAKQIQMARKVIEGLDSEEVTFESPVDEALPLKRDLIAKAAAGEAIEVPDAPPLTASTADLEEILEASLVS